MVRVSWFPAAVAGIEAARRYVAQFNEVAAGSLAKRLIQAGESLADFPNRGRPSTNNCRELTIIRPYIIRYEGLDGEVNILRVRHCAMSVPDDEL